MAKKKVVSTHYIICSRGMYDCYAYAGWECRILNDDRFHGKSYCPFYCERGEAARKRAEAEDRVDPMRFLRMHLDR